MPLPPIEDGTTFYWKADGIDVNVLHLWVDEDGVTQVRVQDGDQLLTLTAEDIRERLAEGILVESRDEALAVAEGVNP